MRLRLTVNTAGLVAAALGGVLAGCPRRVPPADLSRDPAVLMGEVQAAQARVRRVHGMARVKISSPGPSGSVTEFVAAEKPDRVRLETLDFFGNPAAVLVAAGGRFAFLDTRENVFYRGEATPENVSRLLPVVIPVEELVTILCGSAPLLPGKPLEVGIEDGLLLLTIGLDEVGQRLAIGERASVEWSRVRRAAPGGGRDDAVAYDLAFDRFRERLEARFPLDVRLDAPAGGSRVELTWREEVDVNGPVDPKLFEMVPPRNARVVEVPAIPR